MVQSLSGPFQPPPHLYLVPMTGAFCVILRLALSHFLTRMLAVVSDQMEQMTDENPKQSANWKHLQGGKGGCWLGGAGREGRPKRVAPETYSQAGGMSFWETESQFSLRAWPLEGQPHYSGWIHRY